MRTRFGECSLDTSDRVLLRSGEPVHLTPKAFQLLAYLLEVRPRAVAKQELHEKLWPDTFVTDGNLPALVQEIRTAIGDVARQSHLIRTIHGFGYAFIGDVTAIQDNVRSVVVLPFDNVQGDHELDYLCSGIAENITNSLSRLRSFRVLSPRTAARLAQGSSDPDAVARQLQVETVIHGRLTSIAGRLAIQVDAVDVASGTQLWGHRFQCGIDDIARVEEDVAAEIVEALRLRLSADDMSRVAGRSTSNPHAYDLYLRGRFHWNRRTAEGVARAIDLFQQAIVADPEYALPHCGIADSYASLGSRDLIPPREAFSRALPAAARALELAPTLSEAHASLGAIAEVHGWDWNEAGRKYRRAIDLSPSYATAHQWYALHLARMGRAQDAEAQMTRALSLDPLSAIGLTNSALITYLARDFTSAGERIERSLDIEPESAEARLVRGSVLEATGKTTEAIADYRFAVSRSPRFAIGRGFLGHALVQTGCRAEAEEILGHVESANEAGFAPAAALIRLALGEEARALERLETAIEDRSGWLVYMRTDPRLDPLRGSARFERILATVGFAAS